MPGLKELVERAAKNQREAEKKKTPEEKKARDKRRQTIADFLGLKRLRDVLRPKK